MSYIGQQLPADVFAGFTIDKFTGTGVASQTLTLSKAPLGETALLVTIDGVVQEPTDDFTVSGTTVTIVGTAPLNSEINVTHLSGTVPNTLASAVDVNGLSDGIILDADADTTISADTDDQIDIKIAGADDIKITANKFELLSGTSLDMDGLSTKVAAGDVMFQGGKVANTTLTNGTYTQLQFTSEGWDRGNNFASNTFTAPKDGVYLFHVGFRPSNFAVDRLIIVLYKNDSNVTGTAQVNTGEGKTGSGEYPFIQVSNLLSLSQGDTVKHYGYQNSGGDQDIFQATQFIVRLGTFD
jgi:hypothetical protein